MRAASRTTSIPTQPRRVQISLTLDELARAAGVSPRLVTRLVRLGLIEPTPPDSDTFTTETAARLRRMLRLRADLGVNFAGAAIIVDLVARLQWMDDTLARLRGVTTPIPHDKEPT